MSAITAVIALISERIGRWISFPLTIWHLLRAAGYLIWSFWRRAQISDAEINSGERQLEEDKQQIWQHRDICSLHMSSAGGKVALEGQLY